MEKQLFEWKSKEKVDMKEVYSLASALNDVHPAIAEILIRRGVDTFVKARNFFNPSIEDLLDPYLMRDMDKAVERIGRAFDEQEKIRVYGDYDVDGVTSVSMMYKVLRKHHNHVDYYIPDRYKEGYGVSEIGIRDAHEKGVKLIVSLDCGIKANENIQLAKDLGIDFIVCDHHEPGASLPPAVAILDPKRPDCEYPFKGLSGCGVGFKLLQALSRESNVPESDLGECLDLLAISIAADIVPIEDENRILAYYGLEMINRNPGQGIARLIAGVGLKRKLKISDVVFKIAPAINAAGRLESATSAVKLLIEDDVAVADTMVTSINDRNMARRELDKTITTEALLMIGNDKKGEIKNSTVLYQPNWHKGVIGIVASRVMETYYRPTIILTESNGMVTGSARSVRGYNVYKAIEACSDLLDQFGGHMYAAGLSLKEENLEAFKEKFESVVSNTILPEQLIPTCDVDAEINLRDITARFYRVLNRFEPFGPGNMNPVFRSNNLLGTDFKVVGKDHLKFKVFQAEAPDELFEVIAFGMQKYENELCEGMTFSMVYTIEENHWNGRINLQLNVKDIRV